MSVNEEFKEKIAPGRKNISISETYRDRINELKQLLGLNNDSEVIRRALDKLAEYHGIIPKK